MMSSQLAPFIFWGQLMFGYALLMGVEAPILLFITHYQQRPWYRQLLALTPSIAFMWTWNAARNAHDTYLYWLSYLHFQAARYPATFVPAFARDTATEIHASVLEVIRQGRISVALMAAMLVFGWALLVRWRLPQLGQRTTSTPAKVPSENSESGTLEITVEPIDRH